MAIPDIARSNCFGLQSERERRDVARTGRAVGAPTTGAYPSGAGKWTEGRGVEPMGTLGDDNGGPPPGGGGLPDLPPEWGVIIIPDDPSELAPEIDEVRRELRR